MGKGEKKESKLRVVKNKASALFVCTLFAVFFFVNLALVYVIFFFFLNCDFTVQRKKICRRQQQQQQKLYFFFGRSIVRNDSSFIRLVRLGGILFIFRESGVCLFSS